MPITRRIVTCAFFLLLPLAAPRTSDAVECVRVDAADGAPRLIVDGVPVRARIFWGGPGVRPVPVGPTAREVTFEFTPTEDEPAKATLHFRFGQQPGDVYLDDIHAVDLTDGHDVLPPCDFEKGQESFSREWNVWPVGKQNTVATVTVEPKIGQNASAGLHVAIHSPRDGVWPGFHIYHQPNLSLRHDHRYRVTFWAKAEPARDLDIAFYRPGKTYTMLGGPPGVFESQIQLAAAAGVNFVSFPVRVPWPQPGQEADWQEVDSVCRTVLNANPKALLIPRISVDAPDAWIDAHPDEEMVWDIGKHEHRRAAVASDDYRHDAAEHLGALIEHLESIFGPHMAGYHTAGQNTDEWFYQDTWGAGLSGYSKCEERAWRRWLQQRYANNDALRAAWHDPAASLESAPIPSPAARRAAPAGVLRDPVTERPIIDFTEFQQEMMADCVRTLAHAARVASKGRKLVLFFYGYLFEFAANPNGPATSGHYALRRVLDCPDIDVLCSPISYSDRGLGQSAPAMTAAESVALAGKMWLFEDDTYTYRATGTPPGSDQRVDTLEKTNQELIRNVAECSMRNFGTWWMDLGATGWFNDPGMWEQMARLSALDQRMLDHPRPFHPEIAAVIDERSMDRVAFGGTSVTAPGVAGARRALGRMGAPYGQYLLDDVMNARVHAKAYIFLTAWRLDPAERHRLLAATAGTLRVWCYAPGYQDESSTTLDGMHDLTSFHLQPITKIEALATPTALGKSLGLTDPIGIKRPIKPLFAATDATPDETLATYPDGSAAIALRHTPDGLSLFVGPPGLTPDLLRLAARRANAHLFTQHDCNIYANGPFVVLHASQDGDLEIDTGHAGTVRDLLTGQILGQGPRFTLPLQRGRTRVLSTGD